MKMYTLEKVKEALPSLDTEMKKIPTILSVKVTHVSPAHVYYTDGEAQGTIAVIQFESKITNPDPFTPKSTFENFYLFPDGRLLTHFVNDKVSWEVTKSCIDTVKKWLETIA